MSLRNLALIVILALLAAADVEVKGIENMENAGESFSFTQPSKPLRYANPLVVENAGRLADPTVIKFKGQYYLYVTGGFPPGGLPAHGLRQAHAFLIFISMSRLEKSGYRRKNSRP